MERMKPTLERSPKIGSLYQFGGVTVEAWCHGAGREMRLRVGRFTLHVHLGWRKA